MVGLEVELVERRKELRHCAHALVRHVDAVVDGQGHQAGVQRRPETLTNGDRSAHLLYFLFFWLFTIKDQFKKVRSVRAPAVWQGWQLPNQYLWIYAVKRHLVPILDLELDPPKFFCRRPP